MEVCIMSEIDSLKEQIEKTETILAESRENYAKNPDQYSAKLLFSYVQKTFKNLGL